MDREASIVRDVFIFNMTNKEMKKQLCMEKMSPGGTYFRGRSRKR